MPYSLVRSRLLSSATSTSTSTSASPANGSGSAENRLDVTGATSAAGSAGRLNANGLAAADEATAAASLSMPVATTETRILPFKFSLKAEPQMMLASGSTNSRMWFAASSTSIRRISSPPVIETITPFAPCIDTPSSSGLEIALSAASSARPSPSASPVPIIALPISCITERTSAKSRLMRPGITIRSVMPRTPCCSTSSASRNASLKVVLGLATKKRFWFGMTINVSTCRCSSSIPASAERIRREPSKMKGLVMTPTVRIFSSRAACAITGAAPVPVPPPIPAAMKHICAPANAVLTCSMVSSAAARPTSGRDPAPRPWVISGPSWMRYSAGDAFNACASVFATMKSTPSTLALIILATALPPAPPTPITAIFGFNSSTTGGPILMLMTLPPCRIGMFRKFSRF